MKYPEEIAFSKLVDWCNKAERCRFDTERKLKLWGAQSAFIDACIDRLQKRNLLNDARFASAFAHDKSSLQRWGVQKIRTHLKARRVADEYIKEALSMLETETHRENIRELAARRWPSIKGKTDYERTSKLIQFLLRKGFTYDSIRKELTAADFNLEEFNHL
jgi:regulatory protein